MASIPRFYVYVLARPNGTPFYVGKGRGRRVYDHENEARKGHKCHKCSVIRKIWRYGGQVQRYIVFTTDDEQEALAYEVDLIALYGRRTLCNLTDGGDSPTVTDETRAKMRAVYQRRTPEERAEHRRKLSEAHRGQRVPEARRLRMIGSKCGPCSDERKRNISAGNTGKVRTKEMLDRLALAHSKGRAYCLISPDGVVYRHIVNLSGFAREHNLLEASLRYMLTKSKTGQYRGWTGWIEEDNHGLLGNVGPEG